jgi:hypothetical protein
MDDLLWGQIKGNWECPTCKEFVLNGFLTGHIWATHQEEGGTKCLYCEEQLGDSYVTTLEWHLTTCMKFLKSMRKQDLIEFLVAVSNTGHLDLNGEWLKGLVSRGDLLVMLMDRL